MKHEIKIKYGAMNNEYDMFFEYNTTIFYNSVDKFIKKNNLNKKLIVSDKRLKKKSLHILKFEHKYSCDDCRYITNKQNLTICVNWLYKLFNCIPEKIYIYENSIEPNN
jgi:hypothetical protein